MKKNISATQSKVAIDLSDKFPPDTITLAWQDYAWKSTRHPSLTRTLSVESQDGLDGDHDALELKRLKHLLDHLLAILLRVHRWLGQKNLRNGKSESDSCGK